MVLNFNKKVFVLTLILLVVTLMYPYRSALYAQQKKVVVTILPLYIFTLNLTRGIEGFNVELLLDGSNADPHFHTLSLREMKMIATSPILVANGKVEESLDFMKIKDVNSHLKIILVHEKSAKATNLPKINVLNPHTWLSPKRAILESRTIAKGLIDLFPQERLAIENNLDGFTKRLKLLSRRVMGTLSTFSGLGLVTFHDGLDIFCADYNVEIIGHVEDVMGVPPSPRKIARLVEKIRKFPGRVIIVSESSSPERITEKISRISGAPVVWFDPMIVGEKQSTYYEETMEGNVKRLIDSVKIGAHGN